MGIIYRQSVKNTVVTYLGFGIGALNVLFLYTRFLTEEYFGLVGVILSTSAIVSPLLAFGIPNTMVKFFSGYTESAERRRFLSMMLAIPLFMVLPIALVAWLGFEAIAGFLAGKNPIVGNYVWYIFLIAVSMAYFEVFYAWSKVHLKSVFGNFMKEVFARLCITLALLSVYLNWLSVEAFLMTLVGIYLLRAAVMKLYAYSLTFPRLTFRWPANAGQVLGYSAFIVLGGSVAVILLEIDRFMINQYIPIKNVAYYTVAIFIATVIAVPSRAMHQITYPLTASIMNAGKRAELSGLYKKSSLTLFIVSGIIFLLVLLNLEELYLLLPPNYRGGITVVFFIGLAKVYDAILGNNNAILFNSEYYRIFLLMGVLLAVCTILLNVWLIPEYGINGAAVASFTAIAAYNTAKLVLVRRKFDILPFTAASLKVLLLLLLTGVLFSLFHFNFHPILNIVFKSILMCLFYGGLLYRLRISEDVFRVLNNWLKR